MENARSLPAGSSQCPDCGAVYAEEELHLCVRGDAADVGEAHTLHSGAAGAVSVEDSALATGMIIGGRYQILRRLSQGGMGVVYQARHVTLESLVAVKILLRPEDDEVRRRFLQEAKVAASIAHPNIVYLSDFGLLDDGRPYLVMEFLEGKTLGQVLSQGALPPLRACRVALQVARGLAAVHEKDIVHRDLKPENIFLLPQDGDEDFAKIVDFGIALAAGGRRAPAEAADPARLAEELGGGEAAAGRLTRPGLVLGTPHYMSPEQARGEEVDARSDQYALGCILFEMLSGQLPYDHPTSLGAIMLQHIQSAVPSLRAGPAPGVSVELDALVGRLMAKEREGRLGSMRAVEHALLAEIDRLDRLSQISGAAPAPAPPRRRLLPMVAPLVLLLLVVGGGAVYKLRARKAEVSAAELLGLRQRALQLLRGDLRDPRPEVRGPALQALGESRDPEQRAHMEPLLKDPAPQVQTQAAEALGQLGDRRALPALQAALQAQPRGAVHAALAGALDQLGEERGRQILEKLLSGADLEARQRAALLLCEKGDASARQLLQALAQERGLPDEVHAPLLGELVRCGDEQAAARLRERLARATRREQQLLYAARLARAGDEQGRAFLRKLAERPGPDQLSAARLLAAPEEWSLAALFRYVLGGEGATPPALLLATEGLGLSGQLPDARTLGALLGAQAQLPLRQAAALGVLRLALNDPTTLSEQSLSWARGALGDPSWSVRLGATAVLGEARAAAAAPLLAGLLRDGDAQVRREALRSLRRLGDRPGAAQALQREAAPGLRALLSGGTPQERLLASGVLLRMGDETQRAAQLAFARDADPEVRQLLMEQLDVQAQAGRRVLVEALSDPAPAVRLAAARRLAAQGDRRAVPVLQQALALGGAGALGVFGLLRRLGVPAAAPAGLEPGARLASLPVAERVALVQGAAYLQRDAALALLLRAARDADIAVRRAVLDVAVELERESEQLVARAVLRILIGDRDAAVRSRAAGMLAALGPRTPLEGAASVPAPREPARPEPARVAPPVADLGVRPDLSVAPADLAPAPAVAAAEAEPARAPEAEPARAPEAAASAQEQRLDELVRAGLLAAERRDARKAQRLLERSSALCARDRSLAARCAGVAERVSFALAQALESLDRLPEAMTEYERVVQRGARGKGEHRQRAQAAMDRLAPRLGRIVVSRLVKQRCQQVTIWMPPGRHQLRLGGRTQEVVVVAEQTVKLEGCP